LAEVRDRMRVLEGELVERNDRVRVLEGELTERSDRVRVLEGDLTERSDRVRVLEGELTEGSDRVRVLGDELASSADRLAAANRDFLECQERSTRSTSDALARVCDFETLVASCVAALAPVSTPRLSDSSDAGSSDLLSMCTDAVRTIVRYRSVLETCQAQCDALGQQLQRQKMKSGSKRARMKALMSASVRDSAAFVEQLREGHVSGDELAVDAEAVSNSLSAEPPLHRPAVLRSASVDLAVDVAGDTGAPAIGDGVDSRQRSGAFSHRFRTLSAVDGASASNVSPAPEDDTLTLPVLLRLILQWSYNDLMKCDSASLVFPHTTPPGDAVLNVCETLCTRLTHANEHAKTMMAVSRSR
jgi:hypothetical protein